METEWTSKIGIKKGRGGRFGLSLKGWGYDILSVSCLQHYSNKIDMSTKNMNKNYTNVKNNDTV